MKKLISTFLLLVPGILFLSYSQDSLQSSGDSLHRDTQLQTVLLEENANKIQSEQSGPIEGSLDPSGIKQSEKLLSVNIFEIRDNIFQKLFDGVEDSRKEIVSFSERLISLRSGLGDDEYRERIFSLAIMLVFAVGAALISGFLLWRVGLHFKNLSGKLPGHRGRFAGTGHIFFTRISFWAALVVAGLCMHLIPVPAAATSILWSTIIAVGMYGFSKSLLHVLWAPRNPQFRLIPWSDSISIEFVKVVSRLTRFSLFIFILYRLSLALVWPVIAASLSGLYLIILTILIPRVVYRFRSSYAGYTGKFIKEHRLLPAGGASVLEYLLNHLYMVVFLVMVILCGASFSGNQDLYSYLIRSSLKTLLLIPVVISALFAWGLLYRAIAALASRYPYLGFGSEQNRQFVERGGHVLVLMSGVLFFVNTWGVNLVNFFRSDNPLLKAGFHILAILIVTFIAVQALNILIARFQKEAASRMISSSKSSAMEVEKRVSTLGGIVKKISLVSVLVIAVMMVMDELGFDIKAMLAGVGIIGLAVGFGAQNLVRDVISGLFLIFENRIRVGDVAIINGTGGLVEQVNLRTSVLRGLDGTIHVFPNGAITSLSNMTHEYSFYLFNIGVAYKEDTDKVISVLKKIGEEIMQEEEYKDSILEPLEVLGVDSFADSAVIIKARIKTLPIKQWMVGREMNRRIKKRFDETGIEIPFPHRSLYFGEASKPVSFKLEGLSSNKEEIREIVREMMNEQENSSI